MTWELFYIYVFLSLRFYLYEYARRLMLNSFLTELPVYRSSVKTEIPHETFHLNRCLFEIFDLFSLPNPLKFMGGWVHLIMAYNPEMSML